jgi:hypothetical protein
MAFRTVNITQYWPNYSPTTPLSCDFTFHMVCPPGLDIYLPDIATQTVPKANATVGYAQYQIITLSSDLIAGAGGEIQASVVTASPSGTGTVDVKLLPFIDTTYLNQSDPGASAVTGSGSAPDPTGYGWVLSRPVGPRDAATPIISTVFGYLDGSGAVQYGTLATASTSLFYWIAGWNEFGETSDHAYLRSVAAADRPATIYTDYWTYPEAAPLATWYASPTAGSPSSGLYADKNGNFSNFWSTTFNRFLGYVIAVDHREATRMVGVVAPTGALPGAQVARGFGGLYARPRLQRTGFAALGIGGTPLPIDYKSSWAFVDHVVLASYATGYGPDNSPTLHGACASPTGYLRLLAPIIYGLPTCAVDVTLPAPFGAVRIVWYAGIPHLCKQTTPDAAPASGMEQTHADGSEQTPEYNPGFVSQQMYRVSAFRGLPGWGDLAYPLSVWPGQRRSGNANHGYGNGTVGSIGMDASPCLIADIPNMTVTNLAVVSGTYFTGTITVTAQWIKCDYVNGSLSSAWNTTVSAEQTLTGYQTLNWGGRITLVVTDTITIKPTGAMNDGGVYELILRVYIDGSPDPDFPIYKLGSDDGSNFRVTPWSFLDYPFAMGLAFNEVLTAGQIKLIPWPLDVYAFSPTANDPTCSWVANTGWAFPGPARVSTLAYSGSWTANWSSGTLQVTARPTASPTVVSGAALVRTADSLALTGAIHARIPALGLRYRASRGWAGASQGNPIEALTGNLPWNYTLPAPSLVTQQATARLWALTEWHTDLGNTVRALSDEGEVVVSVV